MLYYEEAEVKQYYRKNKEGVKKPYCQVGIKKNSKFNKPKPIALVDISEIMELESFLEANPVEEQKTKISELEEENEKLKKKLDKLKQLQEDKLKLQADLLEAKDKLGAEKDTTKTLLLALYSYEEQGYFNKILNKTPELAKQILKENPKPIETKAKPSEE